MKKYFKFLGLAAMALSLTLVSCDKDEDNNSNSNNNNNQTEDNNIDLTKVNMADNNFYLTEAFCEDWTSDQAQWIQGGTQAGTLYYDLHYSSNQVENNYEGAEFNLIIEGRCEVDFYVEEYNPETQYLELSTDEDIYSGTITLTQDSEKVYMTWTGTSYRGGRDAELEGWQIKSKIK